MKAKLFLLFLLVSIRSFSQGEASNWFFGNRAGIKFNADNTITVLSTLPNSIGINTNEGCSSYSDSDGNLLLYTDGRTIWDRNHLIMPNANYNTGTGLFGDPSSTQSGIIVPKPNNPNIFYVFTVDEPNHTNAATYPARNTDDNYPQEDDGFNNGLNYSIVDMSIIGTNGSIGDVTARNEHLITYSQVIGNNEQKYKCSEKITAVKSADGNSYWVITHFVNRFYAFKVDENGVNPTPVMSVNNPIIPISGYRRNAIGYLKASPNGKKIAIVHNQLGTESGATDTNGLTYLYDFNNETGVISNGLEVLKNIPQYGVEFSSQSKKLYVSCDTGVFQFNLLSENIPQSKVLVDSGSYSALQLGPDGKIYKANISENRNYLDVINSPDLDGLLCDFEKRAVFLDRGISTFGLPPFITSVFNSNIIAEGTCIGNAVNFSLDVSENLDSVTWAFGDGNTSTLNEPSHTYENPGSYVIISTAIIEGIRSTTRKTIEILPLPDAFPYILSQCNPDGALTGVLFNLNEAKESITGAIPNLSVDYFISEENAKSNTDPLPSNYSNVSNPQVIYAKVTNPQTGCSNITQLTLVLNSGAPNKTYTIQKCDTEGNEDGMTSFLLSDSGVATDFDSTATVSYHSDINAAFLRVNMLPMQFSNTTNDEQTIYVRVSKNADCLGIFPVKLIVNPLPKIELTDSDYICTNLPNKYATLTSGLLPGNNLASLRFKWSTGEETQNIRVNQAGTYTVTVKNDFGCEKVRTITVLASNNPTIKNIAITDISDNNTVTVYLTDTSIGDYVYSLDSPSGPFQRSNHFENVSPGEHTVYIYDNNGCGIASEKVTVLRIPKFFSPNGDGQNETWKIIGLDTKSYADTKIIIFDRYGKLIYSSNGRENGWDGNFNGTALVATDYWYRIILNTGREIKGHFSLVR